MSSASVIGFDSAWTGNPKKPGAICVLRLTSDGGLHFIRPEMASFEHVIGVVRSEQLLFKKCLVAIDQPTIVANLGGCRPVERVAGSLISWLGGGVQPSNRARKGMFDDAAPIWRFLELLGAVEHPESAREAVEGLFLLEVFPSLALPGFNPKYCERLAAPKYNPERRKTFKIEDWLDVVNTLQGLDIGRSAEGASAWFSTQRLQLKPKKSDQDMLDAVICAFVGLHWLIAPRSQSMMIGNLEAGYIVSPALNGIHHKLTDAASRLGVPIDGRLITA